MNALALSGQVIMIALSCAALTLWTIKTASEARRSGPRMRAPVPVRIRRPSDVD